MRPELTNVDVFNLSALRLLSLLFESFPQPIALDADDLAIEADTDFGMSINETIKFVNLAPHTITWLAEEGFLRYEKAAYPGSSNFLNVRLSLKGLMVLGYSPTALQSPEKQKSLITRIKEVVATGAQNAGSDLVKNLLGEVLRMSVRQVFPEQLPGILES